MSAYRNAGFNQTIATPDSLPTTQVGRDNAPAGYLMASARQMKWKPGVQWEKPKFDLLAAKRALLRLGTRNTWTFRLGRKYWPIHCKRRGHYDPYLWDPRLKALPQLPTGAWLRHNRVTSKVFRDLQVLSELHGPSTREIRAMTAKR